MPDKRKTEGLNNNGWDRWQNYVLNELKRLNSSYEGIVGTMSNIRANDLTKIKTEISALKVKSGIWGLMGGMIPAIIAIIIWFLSQSK